MRFGALRTFGVGLPEASCTLLPSVDHDARERHYMLPSRGAEAAMRTSRIAVAATHSVVALGAPAIPMSTQRPPREPACVSHRGEVRPRSAA